MPGLWEEVLEDFGELGIPIQREDQAQEDILLMEVHVRLPGKQDRQPHGKRQKQNKSIR